MGPSFRDWHVGVASAIFEIIAGMDGGPRIPSRISRPQKGRFVMGNPQPSGVA